MEIIHEKTWGVCEGYYKGIKKWFILCDGKKTDLCYANKEFAMNKSKNFITSLYKPFVDFRGNSVKFIFKQI